MTTAPDEIADILAAARPKLVRALIATRGTDGAEDAAAEAIAWGWENQQRLAELEAALDGPDDTLFAWGYDSIYFADKPMRCT